MISIFIDQCELVTRGFSFVFSFWKSIYVCNHIIYYLIAVLLSKNSMNTLIIETEIFNLFVVLEITNVVYTFLSQNWVGFNFKSSLGHFQLCTVHLWVGACFFIVIAGHFKPGYSNKNLKWWRLNFV